MSSKTKEALIEAFLELVNEKDFDKISVTDLVEKCGISRQTFYYHFEDIQKMLEWSFNNEMKRICDAQDSDNWNESADEYVAFFNKYDTLIRKSINSLNFVFIYNLIEKSFYDCITSYIAKKRSKEQIFGKNADFIISYTAGAFTSLVVKTIQCEESDYRKILNNLTTAFQGI